jgi:glycosyltransferase involved in cell wall biosynthesis
LKKKQNILFVVENNPYPRDIRVYNESLALLSSGYNCSVIAPKFKGEKYTEIIDKGIHCFRYPHYDAKSNAELIIEYFNAMFWLSVLVPFICLKRRISFIHVANPPDFIIPLNFWLQLFGIKFIFDQHDLSPVLIKSKLGNKGIISKILISAFNFFECLSYKISSVTITVNDACKIYIQQKKHCKKIEVVRNSNPIYYKSINEISKINEAKLTLGFIGILLKDADSGILNLVFIANSLKKKNVDFKFIVVGDGPGREMLETEIQKLHLEDKFYLVGFKKFHEAVPILSNFDFGIVALNYSDKASYATSSKVMDYMCCGVPVCALKFEEQMKTTKNIGVYVNDFDEMVEQILIIHNDKKAYENLREETLDYFNTHLSWEKQKEILVTVYDSLNKK